MKHISLLLTLSLLLSLFTIPTATAAGNITVQTNNTAFAKASTFTPEIMNIPGLNTYTLAEWTDEARCSSFASICVLDVETAYGRSRYSDVNEVLYVVAEALLNDDVTVMATKNTAYVRFGGNNESVRISYMPSLDTMTIQTAGKDQLNLSDGTRVDPAEFQTVYLMFSEALSN